MENRYGMPPLRIILTGNCNGKCEFCHKEGNDNSGNMPLEMVYACIDSAEKLSISQIALTGGEPTLREDLKDIIDYIQKKGLSVSLTTNGYRLREIADLVADPIANLNLSMSSLKKELAEKYQNVNPDSALSALRAFPAENKTINVVITKENYAEISEFIKFCGENNITLDIMFENIEDHTYKIIQKKILNELIKLSGGEILLRTTPVLKIELNKCNIRIKHPYLSKLLHNGICNGCKKYNSCFEKVCAIRVHPNGIVTPCLSKEICADGETMLEKIKNAYDNLHTMNFDDQFFNY